MAVGEILLARAVAGAWPVQGFPKLVSVQGRTFRRSDKWAWQHYPGVVAQYREDVDRHSRHLMVLDDGSFRIDHIDEANPERGLVLEHAAKDVLGQRRFAALALLGIVAGVAGVCAVVSRLRALP